MNQPAAGINQPDQAPWRRLAQRTLEATGDLVTSGNSLTPTFAQLKRWGACALMVGVAAAGVKGCLEQSSYVLGSDIPSTQQGLDPTQYKRTVVPNSGAFGLASEADGDHDPRNGLGEFERQLGHPADPGDIVFVPRD